MAVAAFRAWERAGRPLTPARPVRELVAALKTAYPAAAARFGWYADSAHYESNQPEDHTPFSVTDWPVDCPRWVVFATDVMPGPGYSLKDLAAHWVAEARADRIPSLKYLIYGRTIYTTWRGFRADQYFGEYHGHIHVSFRTDYETTGFGTWSPISGGGDTLAADRAEWITLMGYDGAVPTPPNWPNPANKELSMASAMQHLLDRAQHDHTALETLLRAVVAVEARDKVAAAAIAAITALIKAGGGDIDTAAILARLDEVAAELAQEQATVVADLQAEIARLREALLAAARAQAEILDHAP